MSELKFREPIKAADVLVDVAELNPAPGSIVVIRYPAGLCDVINLLKEFGGTIAKRFDIQIILLPDNFAIETLTKEDLQLLGVVSS